MNRIPRLKNVGIELVVRTYVTLGTTENQAWEFRDLKIGYQIELYFPRKKIKKMIGKRMPTRRSRTREGVKNEEARNLKPKKKSLSPDIR